MEFWGVEVKPGEQLKLKPEIFELIHISQASMGEVNNGKGPEKIHIHLKIDGKDFVIGTLSTQDRPQVMFDLVLHKEFEVSHDWKEGSIYLLGYVGQDDDAVDNESEDEESLEDEDMQVDTPQSGKVELQKSATNKAAAKHVPAEKSFSKDSKGKKDLPTSDEEDDGDDDVDSDYSDDSDDEEANKISMETLKNLINGEDNNEDESDDEDEDDDESDDEDGSEGDAHDLGSHKKRPSETATNPVQAAKKAKLAASNKSGEKTHAANGNFKGRNQKSGGQKPPKAQNKPFSKGNAPNSKAKHGRK